MILMMRIGTVPEHGEIVLIPIPFTDLSSHKRRPVIVISNDEYNKQSSDVVVVAMTSTTIRNQYSFSIHSDDLIAGSLNRSGTVRVDKLYTLDQRLIIKVFGRVNHAVLDKIQEMLRALTNHEVEL